MIKGLNKHPADPPKSCGRPHAPSSKDHINTRGGATMPTRDYNDRKVVNAACEAILKVIKPGDVVNQVGERKGWEFWLVVTYAAIRWHQKKLFGKDSNWMDTHTMLFFDKKNTFSVELPKAIFKSLHTYCLSTFSIYRLRLTELTPDCIKTLKSAAKKIKGEDYDIGQLLDIAIYGLLGYDHQRPLPIFDFGKKKKVCSVGVRAAFEYLYKKRIKTADSRSGKWLFYELNQDKWPPEAIREYKGTDVEATSPAHFANSDYFCFEFELIATFDNGKEVFKE